MHAIDLEYCARHGCTCSLGKQCLHVSPTKVLKNKDLDSRYQSEWPARCNPGISIFSYILFSEPIGGALQYAVPQG
jgi:hypothetical protein